MISASNEALSELKRIAEEEGNPPRVRVGMKGGGCSGFSVDMSFTKHAHDEEHDEFFTIGGVEFIIDKKSAIMIENASLEFGGGLLDRGFKWEFPKSTGGCGCGVSFSF